MTLAEKSIITRLSFIFDDVSIIYQTVSEKSRYFKCKRKLTPEFANLDDAITIFYRVNIITNSFFRSNIIVNKIKLSLNNAIV